MSPTEPRSEQEIRADLARAGRLVTSLTGSEDSSRMRLLNDVAPLLDALSAALAAKEAAEQERDAALEMHTVQFERANRLERHRAVWQANCEDNALVVDEQRARAERAEAQVRAVEALCDRYERQAVAPFGTGAIVETVRAALAAVSPPEPTPEEKP